MSHTGKMESNDDDIRRKFSIILKKAESLGLTVEQLKSLDSVKSLSVKRSWHTVYCGLASWTQKNSLILSAISAVFLAIFISISAADWPVSKRNLFEFWFHQYYMDLDKEPCLLFNREGFADFARPPVDCNICMGIEDVDRVSRLTPDKFEAKYAYSSRPVVITDGMESWTAKDLFSFEFFKSIYAEDSPVLLNVEQNCQFFPYKTNFQTLGEVFNMSSERSQMKDGSKPWYVGWSNCDSAAANILRQHYSRPYFLPQVAESSKTDWIFMGSPGYGAHLHIDNVGNPSWQAQITGTKRWVLEPPPECYHVCNPHLEVTVQPGEIIVVDTNRWFHSTVVVSDEMSITIGSEYD